MLEVRAQETVTDVKQAFDFDGQMQRRPWSMVGGSVLVGYTLARLVGARRTNAISRSTVLDAPPQQQHRFASTKEAVLDVVTGTLWAMAMGLLSRADAGQPEQPVIPSMTSPSDQAQDVVSETS